MAEEGYNYIADLDTVRDSWKLKVRILSMWKTNYQLEMILMDERGEKIHAVVKMNLFHVFEKSLEEGMVVLLGKFGVGENKGKYPVLNHRYKLNFYRCTSVKRCSTFDGPLHGFNFFDFSLINEYLQDPHLPVDIIGCVVDCGNLEGYDKVSGKEGVRQTLELEDLEGVKVKCTLWDDFAEQFHAYVSARTTDLPVVIALQFGRIRMWKEASFQNNYFGSKLYIDSDLEEINDFKKRFMCRAATDTSSQGGSQLSSQRVNSNREEFLFSTKHCTIDEIVDADQPMVCVVLATIKSVEEEHGWYYIACRKHNCKAVKKTEFANPEETDQPLEDDGSLYCKKCNGKTTSVFPSYKVRVRVQDATGSTSFVLFDRDVYKLVHKHASDIRDKQERDGSGYVFPDELSSLVDKMWLFKVEVSNYNIEIGYQVYTVLKVCSHPKIISDFLNMHPDDNDGGANNEEVSGKDKDVVSSTDDSSVGIMDDNPTATTPASKRPRKCDVKDSMAQTSSSKKREVAVKIEKP